MKLRFCNNIIKVLTFVFACIFISCANQSPPPGGEDDKLPPSILKITPKPNSTKFNGNSIKIEFGEYVDRRSLKEAFFISPKPQGDYEFNWSGKDVEIDFQKKFDINKTYSVMIGKGLKDVHGNNLTQPIQFAFSTGDSIDNGKAKGKVYSKKFEKIFIFVFNLIFNNSNTLNPAITKPSNLTQVSDAGYYSFEHLSEGNYRFFAVRDANMNNLFDSTIEQISVLNSDILVSMKENKAGVNFLFEDFYPDEYSVYKPDYYTKFSSDTTGFIYSSIKKDENNISIDAKFIFYFKNNTLNRYEIADNLQLYDTLSKKQIRLIYNWQSDSLLEVIPVDKVNFEEKLRFKFDLTKTKRKIFYEIGFSTLEERKSVNIFGYIKNRSDYNHSIFVKLFDINNNKRFYSYIVTIDSLYFFKDIPQGEYNIISFVDENENGKYDFGQYFPFKYSESFFVQEPSLNLKGGWNIENIIVRF